MSGLTPSQTVGPYFRIGLEKHFVSDLVPALGDEKAIVIEGRVIDADGEPVPDAVIEIWQADESGHYPSCDDVNGSSFRGWGRVPTDDTGRFSLRTVKPGSVPSAAGQIQAPHINVAVFMRGLLRHLFTRIYFGGDPSNPSDSVLSLVPENRQQTLLATPSTDRTNQLKWDIVLQGSKETVFFDW